MNKKQIAQLSLAGIALVLIVFWLIEPEWKAEKILGIISSALLILSMLLSYSAEEKLKKDKDKNEGSLNHIVPSLVGLPLRLPVHKSQEELSGCERA